MDNRVKVDMSAAVKSFKVKEKAKGEMDSWVDKNFTDFKNELMIIISTSKEKIIQSEKARQSRQLFRNQHARRPRDRHFISADNVDW